MDKKINSFCGFSKRSSKLDGAISPNMDFFYISRNYDEFGYDEEDVFVNIMEIVNSVSDNYIKDEENDIILSSNGAVLEAYDLSKVDDLDIAIAKIISEEQMLYPEYELELVEDVFPLDTISGYGINPADIELSTHVLCVRNYKDVLKNIKSNVKRY